MDSYLFIKFGDKYSLTTLKKRVAFLTKLANGAKDISFLNDTKRILKTLNTYTNPSTRWTMFMHVVEAMKIDPGLIKPEARKAYDDAISALHPEYVHYITNNVKNEHDEKLLNTTLPEQQGLLKNAIANHFAAYHVAYKPLTKTTIKKLGAGIIPFAQGLQDLLYLGVYLFQPALRSNWASMRITTKATTDKNNYLFKRGNRMVIQMRSFKNVAKFGTMDIDVRPDLEELINVWLSVLKPILKTTKMPEHLMHYSISSNGAKWTGNDDSLARNLPNVSQRILGRDYGVNGFRKLWESFIQRSKEYAEMSKEQKSEVHGEMLHSQGVAELYNKKEQNAMD
jgi:hypothetical protein